jgi:hypothetical protein
MKVRSYEIWAALGSAYGVGEYCNSSLQLGKMDQDRAQQRLRTELARF